MEHVEKIVSSEVSLDVFHFLNKQKYFFYTLNIPPSIEYYQLCSGNKKPVFRFNQDAQLLHAGTQVVQPLESILETIREVFGTQVNHIMVSRVTQTFQYAPDATTFFTSSKEPVYLFFFGDYAHVTASDGDGQNVEYRTKDGDMVLLHPPYAFVKVQTVGVQTFVLVARVANSYISRDTRMEMHVQSGMVCANK